jgi:hypothetical protein
MKNLLIKYGVIAGGLAAILFLGPISLYNPDGSNSFMLKYGEVVGYGVQLLSMLFVIAGVRLISKQTTSSFGFLRALGAGLGITCIATLVFYLGNVLYYVVLDPDFLTEFMKGYGPAMLEQAETAEEKARLQQEFASWEPLLKNGWLYAAIMCMSVFGFGLVFSLLSAFFYKHK